MCTSRVHISSPAFCLLSHADRGITALLFMYAHSNMTEDLKRWRCLFLCCWDFLFFPHAARQKFALCLQWDRLCPVYSIAVQTEVQIVWVCLGKTFRQSPGGALVRWGALRGACSCPGHPLVQQADGQWSWAVTPSFLPAHRVSVLACACVEKRSEALRKRKPLCPSAPRGILQAAARALPSLPKAKAEAAQRGLRGRNMPLSTPLLSWTAGLEPHKPHGHEWQY